MFQTKRYVLESKKTHFYFIGLYFNIFRIVLGNKKLYGSVSYLDILTVSTVLVNKKYSNLNDIIIEKAIKY